ncbi:hypothetical protein SK128_002473 [Halocaridina rubra]|uniref:Uncharacterized protein n=1 Tax=Halocaridina rubra TaxID=373956 RepID=A0AAN9AFW0_HALRR
MLASDKSMCFDWLPPCSGTSGIGTVELQKPPFQYTSRECNNERDPATPKPNALPEVCRPLPLRLLCGWLFNPPSYRHSRQLDVRIDDEPLQYFLRQLDNLYHQAW